MTTRDVVHELTDKWFPLPPEKFFTDQRAPDMWFGDELPPTLQAEMLSPLVTQSKMMLRMSVAQQLAQGDRQRAMRAEMKRRTIAVSKVGGSGRSKH